MISCGEHKQSDQISEDLPELSNKIFTRCQSIFSEKTSEFLLNLRHGKPEILNTDQGSQFTSKTFSSYVVKQEICLSMDGKGRCIDNVFIERLWWSVKYEDVYIKEYRDGKELNKGLDKYIKKYNNQRRHQSLDNDFPCNQYFPSQTSQILCEEVLEEKYLYLITA
jgi:putative transposase